MADLQFKEKNIDLRTSVDRVMDKINDEENGYIESNELLPKTKIKAGRHRRELSQQIYSNNDLEDFTVGSRQSSKKMLKKSFGKKSINLSTLGSQK